MDHRTFVDAATLAAHLEDPDWVLLDCRFELSKPSWGEEAYAAGHIPGAQYAHLDRDLSSPVTPSTGRHPLPDAAAFARRAGLWGIDARTQVVVYDQDIGVFAARAWWLLRWLGHTRVAILDGGHAAWTAAGRSVVTAPGSRPARSFTGSPDLSMVADATAVQTGLAADAIRLVDARGAERFAGRNETVDPVAGHVPGAVNHPYGGSFDAGRLVDVVSLRKAWRSTLDGRRPQDLVAMCGSGVSACLNLAALEHAGLGGGKLYPGSWSEWIRDPSRPVATGPAAAASGDGTTAAGARRGPSWSVAQSRDLYHVKAWGLGYFDINDQGHVVVRPEQQPGKGIDLHDVVQGLKARDLTAPVVLRFSGILAHRLRQLNDAFARAIAENDYRNRYSAVFPIKVNQQRLVVEEVFRYGSEFGFGLEAGSKPELLAVMAMTENAPDRLIVCNGFKDDAYIETAMLATKLGRTIVPVVENFSELGLIIKHAQRLGVRPRIGVRVKLASEGSGRWSGSAGEKSKFGLFITEILEAVEVLRRHDMLDCLKLVHCHPGSQLQDIRRVKDAINELAHVYAELKLLGAGLEYIDVGGGLGVDYDGSGTNDASSMNYSVEEYANDVVHRVGSVCDARGIPHPMIVSESGRAIAAHHSVLVFNVLGRSALDQFRVTGREDVEHGGGKLPQPVQDLLDAYREVSERRIVECWHDALTAREQCLQMFNLGLLSLELRGLAERLYWATCARIRDLCRKLEEIPEDLEGIEQVLSDIYFCNMSVFQSLPDSWAIDQLFPIMPLHRLEECPTRHAVLADITCDSDGKIDRFVSHREVKRTLEVHDIAEGEEYYLAAFLVGAYQETLGDLHNLFGDTHVVHISLDDQGEWSIEEVVVGDTANRVLEYMEYDVAELAPALARDCERAIREGRMTVAESQALKRFYEGELNGYAYLE
ncbi:MAG: biosynthetic arginine decarboxylase [Gammaproteobacteria bacterium]|jgi:arginine decarboxylase